MRHTLRWVCILVYSLQFVFCSIIQQELPTTIWSPSVTTNDQSMLDSDTITSHHQQPPPPNDRPIIGILSQELTKDAIILRDVGETLTRANLGSRLSLHMGQQQSVNHIQGTEKNTPLRENTSLYVSDLTSNHISSDGYNISPTSRVVNQSAITVGKGSQSLLDRVLNGNATYIAASHVKFVEAAGLRVVPIKINQKQEYYEQILKSINGVLFPGGAVAIDNTSGFGRAGKIIYDLSVAMNAAGDHFPLWGTCLGFELLTGLAAGGQEIRTHCEAQNRADRLKMDKNYKKGHLFQHIPKHLLKALTTLPLTANFHHFCLTPQMFISSGLSKVFRPLAYSFDADNLGYVAAAEAKHAPFFAVQFHPEKSPWEWVTAEGHNAIPHQEVAVEAALYFAQVLGHHARKNNHSYQQTSDEISSLIYNYIPIYTGAKGSPLEQIYIF